MVGSNKINYKKLSEKVYLKISCLCLAGWSRGKDHRHKMPPPHSFFVLCLGTTKRSVPEDLSDLEGAYIKSTSD